MGQGLKVKKGNGSEVKVNIMDAVAHAWISISVPYSYALNNQIKLHMKLYVSLNLTRNWVNEIAAF